MEPLAELLQQAMVFHQQGHLAEAESIYRQILAQNTQEADAWHLLGVLACQQGFPEEGAAHIRQAITLRPAAPTYYCNLGNALQASGQIKDAIAVLQAALSYDPNHAEALNNLGNLLLKETDYTAAIRCFQQAIAQQPDFAEAYNNLGNAWAEQTEYADALAAYQQAIHLQPAYLQAHYNVAQVFKKQERWSDAVSVLQTCLTLNPQWSKAWTLLGHIEVERGQIQAAQQAYQQAEHILPTAGNRIRMELLLPPLFQNHSALEEWRGRFSDGLERLLESPPHLSDPVQEVGMTAFYLPYHGQADRILQEKLALMYRQACPNLTYTAPHCLKVPVNPHQRKRIGFVSRFFRHHTIAKLFGGLVRKLPRHDFEVFVFGFDVPQDQWAADIQRWADRFHVLPADFFKARTLLAEAALDIIFYPDIGMEPMTYFLAFARLAPVQAVSWGHPITTGLDTIDAFFSSQALEQEGQPFYTESLIQMKQVIPYYHRPTPVQTRDRSYFSLPESELILGCLQSLFKLHPDFDPILAEILDSVKQARLLLLADSHEVLKNQLYQRWQLVWPQERLKKVTFLPGLPETDYLALLPLCDIMLDPVHFGGGSTSYEALAAGVPIVTQPSRYLKGRITYALYQQMQYPYEVAHSTAEYVAQVHALAYDEQRHQMQQSILANHHKLYENHEAVAEFATCLTALYQGTCCQV